MITLFSRLLDFRYFGLITTYTITNKFRLEHLTMCCWTNLWTKKSNNQITNFLFLPVMERWCYNFFCWKENDIWIFPILFSDRDILSVFFVISCLFWKKFQTLNRFNRWECFIPNPKWSSNVSTEKNTVFIPPNFK